VLVLVLVLLLVHRADALPLPLSGAGGKAAQLGGGLTLNAHEHRPASWKQAVKGAPMSPKLLPLAAQWTRMSDQTLAMAVTMIAGQLLGTGRPLAREWGRLVPADMEGNALPIMRDEDELWLQGHAELLVGRSKDCDIKIANAKVR